MTDSGLTDLNDPDIKIETETKVTQANNTKLVKDKVEDNEENKNEDGTKAEENLNSQLTILVNGERS